MPRDPGGLRLHCDRCRKPVHDLSAMGPERARALLAATREPICIAYTSDDRGELVFVGPRSPEPGLVPLGRLARAATFVASLSACAPLGDEPELVHPEPTANRDVETMTRALIEELDEHQHEGKHVEEPCEPEPKDQRPRLLNAGAYNPPP